MKACINCDGSGDDCFDPKKNPALRREVKAARKSMIPDNYIERVISFARSRATRTSISRSTTTDWDLEAYLSVSGFKNSEQFGARHRRIPARRSGRFRLEPDLSRLEQDRQHDEGAGELWEKISYMPPGPAPIPESSSIPRSTTGTPAPAGGDIVRASNPCSEYMFLDDTACNLASLNLMQFRKGEGVKTFDVPAFEHAVRLWTIVLEISVLMAQFPSREIAQLSYDYRTLGLGFANIGGLLMAAGISYDSREGRAIAGAISAVMTGVSYATSAEMAGELGPFPEYSANRDAMLRVMRNHRRAAHGERQGCEKLATNPVPLDLAAVKQDDLADAAKRAWDDALSMGEEFGFRNAQATVIAPTGTIGLVMDCDTTGVEPDFALVKFKARRWRLFQDHQSLRPRSALTTLGYNQSQIDDIIAYAVGHGTLEGSNALSHGALRSKGFGEDQIAAVEAALEAAFDIRFVFNKWTLGAEFCTDVLKLDPAAMEAPDFDLLKALGFARAEIDAANLHVCGAMTLEGAPHLKEDHLAVFDCANPCGRIGKRSLSVESHIRMLAATQPFISGAISKTINMPNAATVKINAGESYIMLVEARYQGQRALSRRFETFAAAQPSSVLQIDDEDDAMEDAPMAARTTIVTERIVERIIERERRKERERLPYPPQGLHPESGGRRPQGLSAHRRIRGWPHRRNLHRHA